MRKPTSVTRRGWQATLIISLFFIAVAAAAGTGWWYARESPPHQGPIVLISVEALRARQLPAYGAGRQTATPAIDALAADGVLFTRAYSHSPYTLPAHASLLTGQLPFEHGVRYDTGYTLEAQARTMAEQLQNRGFATGGVVSSFLLRRETGLAQGFSYFNGDLPPADPGQAPRIERDGLAAYSAAEQWLRLQSGQRYFLFIEVTSDNADTVVSNIVQHLKDRELYDGATIVLTAAHGDTGGARLDDRSLAIPLIVKQPEGEGAGRNVSVPVQLIDIAPTLLDLVRAPVPGNLRGRSLRPILDDDNGEIGNAAIYAETLDAAFRTGGPPVYAVTLDGFRLTRGATDLIAKVDETAEDSMDDTTRATRLRAALDRLLEGVELKPAEAIPADLEAPYAAAGYLPTLRALREPVGPGDPEAQATLVEAHRSAVRLVSERQYAQAATALKALSDTQGGLPPVQFQIGALLARSGRFGEAIATFIAALMTRPDDPELTTALAATHFRARALDDAGSAAADAIVRAEKAAIPQLLADAHEVAMRVALARRDAEAALLHAQQAEKADPARPLTAFVRGRLAYEDGKYEDALTSLMDAARAARDHNRQIRELHQILGDTLAQLDRFPDAEAEFKEELRLFPDSVNAYASLAMLYRASNREDAVQQTIASLVAAAPTPDGYATAARLWTIVGERARADAIRADARRRFGRDAAAAN